MTMTRISSFYSQEVCPLWKALPLAPKHLEADGRNIVCLHFWAFIQLVGYPPRQGGWGFCWLVVVEVNSQHFHPGRLAFCCQSYSLSIYIPFPVTRREKECPDCFILLDPQENVNCFFWEVGEIHQHQRCRSWSLDGHTSNCGNHFIMYMLTKASHCV